MEDIILLLQSLLCNAKNALEVWRHKNNIMSREGLEIRLVPSIEAKSLTVMDNGIGMTKDHLIDYIINKVSGFSSYSKAHFQSLLVSSNVFVIQGV